MKIQKERGRRITSEKEINVLLFEYQGYIEFVQINTKETSRLTRL